MSKPQRVSLSALERSDRVEALMLLNDAYISGSFCSGVAFGCEYKNVGDKRRLRASMADIARGFQLRCVTIGLIDHDRALAGREHIALSFSRPTSDL